MKRYTNEGRLSEVIALISLLAVDEYTFRKISNLDQALRGSPNSVESKKWEDIAKAHPEFFRFNGNKDCIALLIRSYFSEDENKRRKPLEVAETQKLIDTAIALHDKEIAFKQRYSYLFPLLVALMAMVGTIISVTISNNNTNKKTRRCTLECNTKGMAFA